MARSNVVVGFGLVSTVVVGFYWQNILPCPVLFSAKLPYWHFCSRCCCRCLCSRSHFFCLLHEDEDEDEDGDENEDLAAATNCNYLYPHYRKSDGAVAGLPVSISSLLSTSIFASDISQYCISLPGRPSIYSTIRNIGIKLELRLLRGSSLVYKMMSRKRVLKTGA